jgi:hypothetical protein
LWAHDNHVQRASFFFVEFQVSLETWRLQFSHTKNIYYLVSLKTLL